MPLSGRDSYAGLVTLCNASLQQATGDTGYAATYALVQQPTSAGDYLYPSAVIYQLGDDQYEAVSGAFTQSRIFGIDVRSESLSQAISVSEAIVKGLQDGGGLRRMLGVNDLVTDELSEQQLVYRRVNTLEIEAWWR